MLAMPLGTQARPASGGVSACMSAFDPKRTLTQDRKTVVPIAPPIVAGYAQPNGSISVVRT